MPGMYDNNHYDLAGFVVGVVDRKQILPNCSMMKVGDYIVGLESSGNSLKWVFFGAPYFQRLRYKL